MMREIQQQKNQGTSDIDAAYFFEWWKELQYTELLTVNTREKEKKTNFETCVES